ncbi:MAG TPA: hypothetical protein VK172_10370 [Lentimicrobium sp.]|nr:hypothetical protein [Lentimicrobium sp.]
MKPLTFKQKRDAKKYAKLLFWVAYLLVAYFFLSMGYMIYIAVKGIAPELTNNGADVSFWSIMLFMLPLVLALLIGSFGQFFITERVQYKRSIKNYRNYKWFTFSISNLLQGNYDQAIHYYLLIHNAENLRSKLVPMFYTYLFFQGNEKQKAKGKDLIREDYLEKYDYTKVFN